MPRAKLNRQEGFDVEHTVAANGAAIDVGDFVPYDDMLGIAAQNIAAGETGIVYIKGVYEVDCKAQAINVGDIVNYDASEKEVTVDATAQATDIRNVGKCLEASPAASERVVILLTPEGSITHS